MQLHLTHRPVDLLTEPFDVALRYGALPDSSLVAVPLGASEQRVVASPRYWESHAAPKTPAHLADRECLLFGVENPSLRATWTLVGGNHKTDVTVPGRFAPDDLLALRSAALAGLQLARLPAPTIAADLESGALVSVLDSYTSVPAPLHIVHVGGRLLPARTRALIDFLVERRTRRGRAPRKPASLGRCGLARFGAAVRSPGLVG